MAKMFYTMDETKAALGKSEDEVKELAKEGRLREFRDGARLMFKTDQVETLKRELGDSGDALSLAPADDDIPLAEAKDSSSSGSGITLADSSLSGSTASTKIGTAAGTKAGSTSGGSASDDTALAADLGLSGSQSGSRGIGGSSSGTRSGIDIFHDDEAKGDPSAATSVAPGLGGDQINIESVGSGSGLLDLTREKDDTSLGASELIDEINPSASGVRRSSGESALSASASGLAGSSLGGSGMGAAMTDLPTASAPTRSAPPIVEAPDPLAPAFAMAALGAAGVVIFAVFAIICGLAGAQPAFLKKLGGTVDGGLGFFVVFGLTLILPVILFVGGMLSGKVGKK